MDSTVKSDQEWQRSASRQNGQNDMKHYQKEMIMSMLGSSRPNEPLHAVVENKLHESALSESNNSVLERNRALLQYIATLADSNKTNDQFNYEFVESLVKGGADINTADQHGQSIFHEVARSWNIDVAKFLLEKGGKVNKQDNFGRTPLHVAVSVDFVEMTEFLLTNNADKDAQTFGELQSPIHYAAKSGAVRSLKMLLGYDVDIDCVDYRQRTPLQIAAEWSRDKTAKELIDEGAVSCLLDSSGNSALSVLIDRLPHLALDALNQLHTTDIITLKESYYLNFLEASRMTLETKKARTPLETAVVTGKFEVVSHPVMQRLIHNKWVQFGRLSTVLDLCFYIVFNIMWTAMSVLTPAKGRDLYNPLDDNIWRVILALCISIMIVYQVWRQVRATLKTIKAQKYWIKWQTDRLEEDLKYCHPRWPQEKKALKQEIKRISKLKKISGTDAWFYYDWLVLFVMLAAIVIHLAYYNSKADNTKNVYLRFLSIVNLLVWLRLLKHLRPFPGIGTLVIILGETSNDFINWAFLFFLILIPFSSAFWIIFGGVSHKPVLGYESAERLLYSVFRMAVGDDFNMEELIDADPVMSRILTVIYITAMTIVTLNLLIALLSDTFTRVHSNAIVNTIMQRAIKVIEAERALSKEKKLNFQEYMRVNCSPEVIKTINDTGNASGGSKELPRNIMTIKRVLDDRFGKVYGKNKTSDFDKIRQDVGELKGHQEHLFQNLTDILGLLEQLRGGKTFGDRPGYSSGVTTNRKNLKESIMPEKDTVKTMLSSFSDRQETETENRRRKKRGGNQKEKHRHFAKRGKKPKIRSPTNRSQGSLDNLIVPDELYEVNPNYDEETSSNTHDNLGFQGNTIAYESEWEKNSVDSTS